MLSSNSPPGFTQPCVELLNAASANATIQHIAIYAVSRNWRKTQNNSLLTFKTNTSRCEDYDGFAYNSFR